MITVGTIVRFKCIMSGDTSIGKIIREVDNIFHVRIIEDGQETDHYRWISPVAIKEIIDDPEANKIVT